MPAHRSIVAFAALVSLAACGSESASAPRDSGHAPETASDAGEVDAGESDAGEVEAGEVDAGEVDAGGVDAGGVDAGGVDAGGVDAGWIAPEPPVFPSYSGNACPRLVSGPTKDTSVNRDFVSFGEKRQFRLVVPSNYDGSRPWPLVIGWHWMNSSSGSFVRDADIERAAHEMEFIGIFPDSLERNGRNAYVFTWPFAETWGIDKDVGFLHDLLACVDEQFEIDHARVHAMGVSAGGLWVTYLSTNAEAQRFATVTSISGGLGEQPLLVSQYPVFRLDYVPQANKFPALVIWGGAFDFLGVDFNKASQKYRDALKADRHFVATCMHDQGHGIPPFEPPAGRTKFHAMWQFQKEHPYGARPPGESPWRSGLPSYFPSWCSIP